MESCCVELLTVSKMLKKLDIKEEDVLELDDEQVKILQQKVQNLTNAHGK